MLVLLCVVLSVAAVPLTGGRLGRLAALRFRRPGLLLTALAAQVVVMQVPGVDETGAAVVHVATYGLAAAFVLANTHVAGLWLLGLGAACNGVVIALNGGTLPASAAAMRTAGLQVQDGFVNSGQLDDPVLSWLGDVFAVPAAWPLANVFSIGDVLIIAGAAWVVHAAARRPDVRPSSPYPVAGSHDHAGSG